MFALAHQIFTELEKDGEVKQDVGWFACTTEEVPDIQFDAELPNQIVMHKSQLVNRSLDFLPLGEDERPDGAHHLVATVLELTGDWVTKVECDSVFGQSEEDAGFGPDGELVYFGTLENLDGPLDVDLNGGDMKQVEALKLAAMIERYEYLDEDFTTSFYVVDDPACATKHGLDPSKSNIAFFAKDSEFRDRPFFLTQDEDTFDISTILRFIQVSAVKSFPSWNKRSHSALFDFSANGLFYVMPKIPGNPEQL